MDKRRELSDRDLFLLFVSEKKDETIFREIMMRYKQKVYWQVRRIVTMHDDADEVTQNVFIKLWKSADSFRFGSSLSSYIYRIAYNESLTLLRQKSRFVSLDGILDNEGHISGMEHTGFLKEAATVSRKLAEIILSLPARQRLVFQYRYYDDLTYAEISEITGTSEGSLKASYHIASEKVKNLIIGI